MADGVEHTGLSRRRFLGGGGAAAGALALGAGRWATGASAAPSSSLTHSVPWVPTLDPVAGAVPSESQMFGWIQQVVAQGIRRPGYPAAEWAEQFAAQRFTELGLQDVRLEPITVDRWEPTEWSLDVLRPGAATVRLESFPVPFSPPVEHLEVDIAQYNPVLPGPVRGKASLVENLLLRIPANLMMLLGTSPPLPTQNRFHDPDGQLLLPVTIPFGLKFGEVLEPSARAGAAAFIGSLASYPGDSYQYYVPYVGGTGPLPGVWVRGSAGVWLRTQALLGAKVRLRVRSTNVPVTSHNVVGELPGPAGGSGDDHVIIGSHSDGPWASAVEDGSGIALVLAQAAYWSQVPPSERPHRLKFLLHGGHMSGGAGLHSYIADHRSELDRAVLELHLEHAAREFDLGLNNSGVAATGRPVPRWWFTSRIPRLEAAVYDALVAEDVRRSMILVPDAFGPEPPTDGGFYHHEGVPIVNFLSAPFYLFDAMDTIDKVDRSALVPLTRAAIRIVESTRGITAAQMRSA